MFVIPSPARSRGEGGRFQARPGEDMNFKRKEYIMKRVKLSLIVFVLMFLPLYASAEFITSFQGAAVYSTRNDVAIPGDTGDELSFVDDLDSDVVFSPRVEAGYEFAGKHFVGFMASLLRLEAEGKFDRDIMFDDKLFAEGTEVEGKYRFDSYRATYRYYFISNTNMKLGAGLTAKIRDAEITLEGGGQKGGLDNTGFAPLINYYFEWIFSPAFSFFTYGDAAWSPYGRAEDIFIGGLYRINTSAALMAGYRMLEGGSDIDKVYTFSMFHYAVLGIEYRF